MTGKKLLTGLLALPFIIPSTYAGDNISTTASGYFTYLNYSKASQKKEGTSFTLLAKILFNKQILSIAGGYTYLDYRDNLNNWQQNDWTFEYSNYQFNNFAWSAGTHLIGGPESGFSSRAVIPFAKVVYYQPYKYALTAFISYSDYREGVNALEFNPRIGKYFWFDNNRGVYAEAEGMFIHTSGNTGYGLKNYYSVGAKVTYFTPKWFISFAGWGGQRMLAVTKDGYVVYNLAEKYHFGFETSANYAIKNNLSLGVGVGYSQYREHTVDKNVGVVSTTLNINYSF